MNKIKEFVKETDQGIILSIKVQPGSKYTSIYLDDGEIVLKLNEPPIDGKANKGVINKSRKWNNHFY